MQHDVHTIDCGYAGRDGVAAAYLLQQGDRAAFVETNTTPAVPRLLAALADRGMTPDQVELIVITHVHLDHAGGAGALMRACPNATLWAHPKAAPHAIDPTKLIASARQVYGDAFDRLYGEILAVDADRVRTAADGETVDFGGRTLTFLHTRGHANHHFCVLDAGSGGIFTGDAFGIIYPFLQARGLFAFPSTTPTDFDADAAHASVDRIVASGASTAYPTHFGPQTDLAGIAAQLHEQLERYAALVDRGDASGRDGDALDDWCRDQVMAMFSDKLAAHGLGGTADTALVNDLDGRLNAQGIAFAIRKRRFKRNRA